MWHITYLHRGLCVIITIISKKSKKITHSGEFNMEFRRIIELQLMEVFTTDGRGDCISGGIMVFFVRGGWDVGFETLREAEKA